MNDFRTSRERLFAGRQALFCLVMLLAPLASLGAQEAQEVQEVQEAQEAPVITAAEREEIEAELRFLDGQTPARAPKNAINCGDNYCRGFYTDLVAYRWEADNGYSGIRVTAAFESFLAASSAGCSSITAVVMKAGHETGANKNATVSRWVAELIAAQVMDYEIQIRWRQSNFSGWNVCILDRFYIWPNVPASP